jgi:hypothetical protein
VDFPSSGTTCNTVNIADRISPLDSVHFELQGSRCIERGDSLGFSVSPCGHRFDSAYWHYAASLHGSPPAAGVAQGRCRRHKRIEAAQVGGLEVGGGAGIEPFDAISADAWITLIQQNSCWFESCWTRAVPCGSGKDSGVG